MPDETEPLPSAPVPDQSADEPKKPTPASDVSVPDQSADEPKTQTSESQVPFDQDADEPKEAEDDVFGGEQDEAARLEIEKSLLTNSDNGPTAEDGEQPKEEES